MSEFEMFLSNLQALLAQHGAAATRVKRPDAIDVELGRPARTTAVTSLRESPAVEAFRTELIDGLIRVDTANHLFRLVNEVMTRVLV